MTTTYKIKYLKRWEILGKREYVFKAFKIASEKVLPLLQDAQQFSIEALQNISDMESFENLLYAMNENFTAEENQLFINMLNDFVENNKNELQKQIGLCITTESILYNILKFIIEKYKNVTYQYIKDRQSYILEMVKKSYLSLNPHTKPDLLQKCLHCQGYYGKIKLH